MLLNRERAVELMGRFGLEALIATTPENVTYTTGFVGWSQEVYPYRQQVYVLLPRSSSVEPGMVVPGQEDTYLAQQDPWIADLRVYAKRGGLIRDAGAGAATAEEQRYLRIADAPGHRDAAEALIRLLRDRALDRARIGVDEDRMAPEGWERLRADLPHAEFVRAASLFRLIRMVKTPDEIARLRRAAEVNEAGYRAIFGAAHAGATDRELGMAYRRAVAEPGGKWHWLHLSTGRRSHALFLPCGATIEPGDLISFDAGMTLENSQADTGGTGVIGEPTEEQRRTHRALAAGIEAAVAAVRPGALPSAVFEAAMAGVRANGVPAYQGIFCGHTIGVEAREFPPMLAPARPISDPFLGPTTDVPLEARMTLNVELPFGRFGWGGMQIEVSIVVTPTGSEPLLPQPRRLEVCRGSS